MAVQMVMSLYAESQLTSLKILDCCCGTGGFLVSWLNNLTAVVKGQELSRSANLAEDVLDARVRSRIKNACNQNLFGLDINPFLVRTAK